MQGGEELKDVRRAAQKQAVPIFSMTEQAVLFERPESVGPEN